MFTKKPFFFFTKCTKIMLKKVCEIYIVYIFKGTLTYFLHLKKSIILTYP